MGKDEKKKDVPLKERVRAAMFLVLRQHRKLQDISQRKLAKRCKILQSRLSRIERHKVVPTDMEIDRLCQGLGLERKKIERGIRSIVRGNFARGGDSLGFTRYFTRRKKPTRK